MNLECSGGIALENVRAYAETGVDFISVGQLTHSAPAVDMSLRVVWHFDPRYLSWDDVPTPVRVPLLYTWAVHNLVPSERRGQFEILAPRKKGMPVDLAFWRRRMYCSSIWNSVQPFGCQNTEPGASSWK